MSGFDWDEMVDFEDVEVEDVEIIAETEKAILCVIDGKQHWIPQSQVRDDSEIWKKGDKGTLVISSWIAEQRGLV